ncbi:hypothetical protein [Marinobacter halophilus]|uniref:Uncharacterized protein n=1 Tax=Marinobacter halophilus TaxID=1323740 RepID=A0A2T1KHH4_9GAMM|nr:hypothetical protein [Marinobacter halophilus]PSF09591.1 hypothetical protein C7H08_03670 [Marinobacter halophilus]GGC65773.1 hypothetical protein GCM10011362_12680 [Marinobacter halophilus]
MKRSLMAVLLVSLLPIASQAGNDHAAAPMKAPHQKPLTEQDLRIEANASQRTESAEAIIERFRSGLGAASPRIAVFWNRTFNDQVSDWASQRRVVISGHSGLHGNIPDGNISLDGTSQAAIQAETRESRRHVPMAPAFDLQAGVVSQLTRAGATIVDRDAIMRITDNAFENGEFSRLSPDQARLEMQALSQHADYLMVLSQVAGNEFSIRVLNVSNGAIQAMVSSNGVPPATDADRRWIATDRGFEKRERQVSLRDVGQELALQTLAEL